MAKQKRLKAYCVLYSTTIQHEAIIEARSFEVAVKSVREIIGEPITIEDGWEVTCA